MLLALLILVVLLMAGNGYAGPAVYGDGAAARNVVWLVLVVFLVLVLFGGYRAGGFW